MNILEKLRGRVDKGEVYSVESTSRSVNFKGWKIHGSESSRESGIGIRVVVNGKMGTAASTDTSPKAIDSVIESAIIAAKFGEEIDLNFPGATQTAKIDVKDDKISDVSIPTLVDDGAELMSRMEKYRADSDMEVDVQTASFKVKVANTEGFQLRLAPGAQLS